MIEQMQNVTIEMIMKILEMPDHLIGELIQETKQALKQSYHENLEHQVKQLREMKLSKQELEDELKEFKTMYSDIMNTIKDGKEPNKIEYLNLILDSSQQMFKEGVAIYLNEDLTDTIIHFQLLHPDAQLPTYANKGDAGMDVYSINDYYIQAGELGVLIPTGLACHLEPGWVLDAKAKSGIAKKSPLRISNGVGLIDSNYKDEIGILFDNIGNDVYHIAKGSKMAQLEVRKAKRAKILATENVRTLGDDRGGGFGSTGE